MRHFLARPFRWIADKVDPPVITSAMIVSVRPGVVVLGDDRDGTPIAEIRGPEDIISNLEIGT